MLSHWVFEFDVSHSVVTVQLFFVIWVQENLFAFQHLGESADILQDIASGKHPFSKVYISDFL